MITQNAINNTVFDNDFSVNRSGAGIPVVDSTIHSSAAAGSTAIKRQQVPDAAVADPFIIHATATTRSWVHGMDTSDGTSLKEGTSASGVTTPSTATITRTVTTAGEQTMPLQPGFTANLSTTTANNQTGDGTSVTVIFNTEQFDSNSDYDNTTGIFTAPVTGRYFFKANVAYNNLAATHTFGSVNFNSTAHGYLVNYVNIGAIRTNGNAASIGGSVITEMTAGDTMSVLATVSNSTKTVGLAGDDGIAAGQTSFSGYLLG